MGLITKRTCQKRMIIIQKAAQQKITKLKHREQKKQKVYVKKNVSDRWYMVKGVRYMKFEIENEEGK